MKAKILGAVAAAMLAGPAIAADIPVKAPVGKAPVLSSFDVAIGGNVASDYIFRGISQSNGHPSGGAYFEGLYAANPSTTYYLGLAATSISWPVANNLSDPAAEVNFYGGVRLTAGKWAYDFGAIFYYYPNETNFNSDFHEFYAKVAYTVSDALTVGGSIFWSPDYLNYGTDGLYTGLSAKYTVKNAYVSGEIGYMDIGGPLGIPSYATWNAGFGWTWKAVTLDFRYHDTDMSQNACGNVWNGGIGSTIKTCGPAYVAKLSFDTTLAAIK